LTDVEPHDGALAHGAVIKALINQHLGNFKLNMPAGAIGGVNSFV
jgi:hypothetical protein